MLMAIDTPTGAATDAVRIRRSGGDVDHLISAISTSSLERLVRALEQRLIAGTARAADIDAYISMQCEIAARSLIADAGSDGEARS